MHWDGISVDNDGMGQFLVTVKKLNSTWNFLHVFAFKVEERKFQYTEHTFQIFETDSILYLSSVAPVQQISNRN